MMSLVLCVAVGLASVVLAAAPPCHDDPWPYGGKNILRRGHSLPVGGSLTSSRATLQLTEAFLLLYRNSDNATLWQQNFQQSATALSLTQAGLLQVLSGTTVLWTANNASATADIAVVTDHCVFALFEHAPLEKAQWTSGPPRCLAVHVVPHSHDDVGWLLTPERYYDGCHSTTGGGARGIYTTVVDALAQDPSRTFVAVEMYFFYRWWQEQNSSTRATVRTLVQERRLVFINAGWSMHDEACVHQESAVSNMAVGNQLLKDLFGDLPSYDYVNVGWHIDPFGHASTTPRLMAEMGFDSFWFWRPGDIQQHNYKLLTRTQETVWLPSKSQGSKAAMFTSILYDSYCSGCGFAQGSCSGGFCCYTCELDEDAPPKRPGINSVESRPRTPTMFDGLRDVRNEQIRRRNPRSMPHKAMASLVGTSQAPHDIPAIAEAFVQKLYDYGWYFRTQNVLVPWGCDFMHNFAFEDYPVMDAVIAYITANKARFGMDVFYSTPDRYVDAVNGMNYSWPANVDDYFVYADYPHAYWSGYFSSRAEYKGFERFLMNERGTAELVSTAVPPAAFDDFGAVLGNISYFQQIMGVAQHHDSITGTERQHVRNRYQLLLTESWDGSDGVVELSLTAQGLTTGDISSCRLANLTWCDATSDLESGANVTVLVINPLSRSTAPIVRIPVPTPARAYDAATGKELPSQLDATWEMYNQSDPTSESVAPMPYFLSVRLGLRPLETASFVLRRTTDASSHASTVRVGASELTNGIISITFNPNGSVASVTNHVSNITTRLHERVGYYVPMPAGRGQAAGAYIFRPESTEFFNFSFDDAAVTTVTGSLCQEVRVVLRTAQNIQSLWRLCASSVAADVMVGAGPLDPFATLGIELVHVIGSTDIRSQGTWYTDSEGLELETRHRDKRPNYPYNVTEPIASNFFPSNVFAVVRDEVSARNSTKPVPSIIVVGDRSRAAGSIHDGELQFLVLRRLLFDDNRGVNQPLDENIRLQSTSRVVFHSSDLFQDLRVSALQHSHPAVTRFTHAPGTTSRVRGMRGELPKSVHLHSRMAVNSSAILVRLQHLYGVDEGAHGVPVQVDLKQVLPAWMNATRAVQMDLNGVVEWSTVERLEWRVCPSSWSAERVGSVPLGSQPPLPDGSVVVGRDSRAQAMDAFSVTMGPLDIKTFIVHHQ